MTCEHRWTDDKSMRRCGACGKVRITIQAFQNGKSVGEYVANILADNEVMAVDKFLAHARIDLRYRFLGENGFIHPSDPNDYLLQEIK